MGQNFSSEPVVDKDTERDHNDTFNVAVSSCQGWRMHQEDNHSMILELPGEHKAAFFAVYDGHGSAKVSKHASESLWRHLVENEAYTKGNFKEALESAFLTFDREVNDSYNAQLAGTTAICLLVVDNVVYCANIGDSRAVASVNCKCVPLSYDHKPENPQELKRILAAGGYVLGNRVNGNLALSRAFGDFHYKGNDQLPPEQQIVSPCPDVKTIELNDDVDFLVLACDGIWDVLSNEEVVEFVISRLEQQMEPGIICEQLTTRCLATDYELVIGCDNMTVLLVCYTRGRSWSDFCTDIFNKNSSRMGVPRTPPRYDGYEDGLMRDNSVPPLGQQEVEEQNQQQQQQSAFHDEAPPANPEDNDDDDDKRARDGISNELNSQTTNAKELDEFSKTVQQEETSENAQSSPAAPQADSLFAQKTTTIELEAPDDDDDDNTDQAEPGDEGAGAGGEGEKDGEEEPQLELECKIGDQTAEARDDHHLISECKVKQEEGEEKDDDGEEEEEHNKDDDDQQKQQQQSECEENQSDEPTSEADQNNTEAETKS